MYITHSLPGPHLTVLSAIVFMLLQSKHIVCRRLCRAEAASWESTLDGKHLGERAELHSGDIQSSPSGINNTERHQSTESWSGMMMVKNLSCHSGSSQFETPKPHLCPDPHKVALGKQMLSPSFHPTLQLQNGDYTYLTERVVLRMRTRRWM